MDLNKTGGHAFPTSDVQTAHAIAAAAIIGVEDSAERDRVYTDVRAQALQGMTLRDYFAAQALPAILAQSDDGITARAPNGKFSDGTRVADWWAQTAYQIADAMLAARSVA